MHVCEGFLVWPLRKTHREMRGKETSLSDQIRAVPA